MIRSENQRKTVNRQRKKHEKKTTGQKNERTTTFPFLFYFFGISGPPENDNGFVETRKENGERRTKGKRKKTKRQRYDRANSCRHLAAQAKHRQGTTGAQVTARSARVHTDCRRHARGRCWQFAVHRGRPFPDISVQSAMGSDNGSLCN